MLKFAKATDRRDRFSAASEKSTETESGQIVYRKISNNKNPESEKLSITATTTSYITDDSQTGELEKDFSIDDDSLKPGSDTDSAFSVEQIPTEELLYILGPYRLYSTINEEESIDQLNNIDYNENVIISDIKLSRRQQHSRENSFEYFPPKTTCYAVGGKNKPKKKTDLNFQLKFDKPNKQKTKSESSDLSPIDVSENYAGTSNEVKKEPKKKSSGIKKTPSFKDRIISPLMKKRFNKRSASESKLSKISKSIESEESIQRSATVGNTSNIARSPIDNNTNFKRFDDFRKHINRQTVKNRHPSSQSSTKSSNKSTESFDESLPENLTLNRLVDENNDTVFEDQSNLTHSDCSFSESDINDMKGHRQQRQKYYRKKANSPHPNTPLRTASPGSSVDSQYGGSTSSLSTVSYQSISTTDVSCLPDKLLIRIFTYLDTSDVCRLSRVCRRWSELYLSEKLWEHIKVTNMTSLDIDSTLNVMLQRLAYTTSCLNIRQMKLDGCKELTDEGIQTMALRCPELRALEIASCDQVTARGVYNVLVNCPNLAFLNLSGCEGVSSFSNRSDIISSPFSFGELKYLDLSSCSCFTDSDIEILLGRAPSLEYLYLRLCDSISNIGIETIARRCPNLKEISLNDCVNITDHGVLKLLDSCHNLRYVSLAKCPITNMVLEQIASSPNNLLRHLNLYDCEYITDIAIMKLSASCPRLRSLDIGKCRKLTDASLYGLSRCTLLRRLNLKGCCKVTDAGLRKLATICKNLRHLDVRDCLFSPETYEYVRLRCPLCDIQRSYIHEC
ncbi:uncharacterized protein [Clytia hemisphaerica]|uniref:F-box domain-containing protein n=1 Tax=Clytia hemisphaerica TaxID=252671 RepID=A0A7M5UQY7_9CNID